MVNSVNGNFKFNQIPDNNNKNFNIGKPSDGITYSFNNTTISGGGGGDSFEIGDVNIGNAVAKGQQLITKGNSATNTTKGEISSFDKDINNNVSSSQKQIDSIKTTKTISDSIATGLDNKVSRQGEIKTWFNENTPRMNNLQEQMDTKYTDDIEKEKTDTLNAKQARADEIPTEIEAKQKEIEKKEKEELEPKQKDFDAKSKKLETMDKSDPAYQALQKEVSDLGNEIASIKGEISNIQGEITALETEKTALDQEIPVLAEDLRTFQNEKTNVSNELKTLNETSTTLTNESTVLSGAIQEDVGQLQNHSNNIKNAQNTINNIETTVDNESSKCSTKGDNMIKCGQNVTMAADVIEAAGSLTSGVEEIVGAITGKSSTNIGETINKVAADVRQVGDIMTEIGTQQKVEAEGGKADYSKAISGIGDLSKSTMSNIATAIRNSNS